MKYDHIVTVAGVVLMVVTVLTSTVSLATADDYDRLAEKVVSKDLADLEELLAGGVDVNARSEVYGGTVLLLACSFEDYEDVVSLLLANGADVQVRGSDGRTPLIWAASRSRRCVEMLLEHDADINATGNDGMTALIHATFGIFSESVTLDMPELLVDRGADVNAQLTGEDATGWTALMFAANNGHPELVELLIARGADVDLQGADGVTALMRAACEGDHRSVNILLAAGADVNLQTANGETAISLAQSEEHGEIVELLRKKGALE